MSYTTRRALLVGSALAAAALTRATPALAGHSCGGGSSGGGGHSSSGGGSSGGGFSFSSSSSSSSSSDSTPAAPACTDETDIVGYRHCTRFGAWASTNTRRLLILEFGAAVHTFQSPLSSATGTVTHSDESFTYRVGAPSQSPSPSGPAQPPSEAAVVSTVRVGSATPRGFYLVAEGELGGLVRNASRVEMTSTGTFGAPSIRPASSLVTGVLGVAGVHGDAGGTTLGVEVAGGVRSVTYQYESRYLSCQTGASQTVSSPVLEVRARAARWLSPFVNVGASAGASVIDRGAWVAGVHLGFATQAYGNLRD